MTEINILPDDMEYSNMPVEVYKDLFHQYRLIVEEYETRIRTGTLTEGGHVRIMRKLIKIQKLINSYDSSSPSESIVDV